MSENGSYKLRNLEHGAGGVGKVMVVAQFYFAVEVRGLVKRLLGNEDYPIKRGGRLC